MPIQSWMIYGAYGYSGSLVAGRARTEGLQPVLGGRNADKTRAVAGALDFEWRAFDLDDEDTVARKLEDIDAVVHCAGPFSATSAPMIAACLASKTHYFDITGEIEVFEHAHSTTVDTAAKTAGIAICPGIGFDVVPTDCIAKALTDAMPKAVELALGFQGDTNMSPGTAKTIVESLGHGTLARRDGRIETIPLDVRDIDYGRGRRQSMSVSWGDVSTAYYTTGIGHITVYWPANDAMLRRVRMSAFARPLLRIKAVQKFLKRQVGRKVQGPSEEQRKRRNVQVWGEVRDGDGNTLNARMTTANGYTVTQLAPVGIIERLLADDVAAGSTTPALLFGRSFASSLEGSSEIVLAGSQPPVK